MPAERQPGGHERLRQPIILVGSPRSGTTLLASLLGSHPDVAVNGEPRLVWRYGNDRRSDQLRPREATDRVVAHIHGRFNQVLSQQGASRLVEKTPANALRPRFVEAVFPDALYVHITRNGWGAVPSMRAFWERRATGMDAKQARKVRRRLAEADISQLRHYLPELLGRLGHRWSRHVPLYGPHLAGLQEVADELGVLEAAAWQWRSCVEQSSTFGRSIPPNRYMEVKLESLDAEVVVSVLDFCGLRRAGEVLERFGNTFNADLARRQAPLSQEECAVVGPYVLPANAWLGYSEAPAPSLAVGPRGPTGE